MCMTFVYTEYNDGVYLYSEQGGSQYFRIYLLTVSGTTLPPRSLLTYDRPQTGRAYVRELAFPFNSNGRQLNVGHPLYNVCFIGPVVCHA